MVSGLRLLLWKIDEHFKLLGKYANYSEDGLFTDTNKYILEIKFYKENSKHGERFSEIFKAADFEGLLSWLPPFQ